MTRAKLLSLIDQKHIERAIADAESGTTGEIRVSIAGAFWGDPRRMAERAFARLGMDQTRERNAVLLFLAPWRRCHVIVADDDANARILPSFWSATTDVLGRAFSKGQFNEGIVTAIECIGLELKHQFPLSAEAPSNSFPDAIDTGGID